MTHLGASSSSKPRITNAIDATPKATTTTATTATPSTSSAALHSTAVAVAVAAAGSPKPRRHINQHTTSMFSPHHHRPRKQSSPSYSSCSYLAAMTHRTTAVAVMWLAVCSLCVAVGGASAQQTVSTSSASSSAAQVNKAKTTHRIARCGCSSDAHCKIVWRIVFVCVCSVCVRRRRHKCGSVSVSVLCIMLRVCERVCCSSVGVALCSCHVDVPHLQLCVLVG